MKIETLGDKIIVFLNKKNIDFNLNDDDKLRNYFKDLFLKLKNNFDMESSFLYNIDVYSDEFYGYILEITSNDEYYNYFDQIDMQINILKNKSFLYEIDYSFLENFDVSYFKKGSKIYIKLNNEINDILLGRIIECSNIIYGEETNDIIRYGEKVKV